MHHRRVPARNRNILFQSLERRKLLTVASGFTESAFVASGLNSATSMAFAPDGRLFVAEQGGAIRIVKPDGTLLGTPFAPTVTSPIAHPSKPHRHAAFGKSRSVTMIRLRRSP